MIEWRIVERREPGEWSNHSSPNHGLSEPKRPGLINYVVAGLTLITTGVLAVFAFSFVLLVVLPVLVIAGLIAAWRWRRLLQKHQQQFQSGQTSAARPSRTAERNEAKGDFIDI